MGKKKEVLGMLEVKYMFQSSLIIFMIISSLALLTFYMNHHHQEMMSPTTTATIVLNYQQQQEDIVFDKKNQEEDGVVLEKKNEEKDSSFEEKNGEEDIRIEKKNEEEDSGIEKKNEEEEEKKDEEEEKKDEEEDIAIEKKKKEEEEEDMAFEKKNEEEEVVIRKVYDTLKYDSLEGCDLFSGKWVLDNETYPLYNDGECPYVYGDFACGLYGRKDNKYQQWRWQPHGCTLPRFDAKEILERLRGKRIILVGDSVMRNQWVSMICMFQSVIPSSLRQLKKIPNVSLLNFKAIEYNVSIDFYWAPLLVESNGDHPTKHRIIDRMVRLDSVENHAKHWLDVDALVFNSYLWWKMPTMKILNGSFEDPTEHYKIVDRRSAYRMGLKAWSNWMHKNINHTRTQIYYMSMTATHFSGVEWGKHDGNCFGETEPITKEGFWESGSDQIMLRILENTLNKMKAKGGNVHMMNISQLTQYRKDAHPAINRLFYSPLTKEQVSDPKSYADCSHWCLPGVPDVWNELLLAYILRGRKQQNKSHEEDNVFVKTNQEKDNAFEKKNERKEKKNEEKDSGFEKRNREEEKKNEKEVYGFERKIEEKDIAFGKKNEDEEVIRKKYDTLKYDLLKGCDMFLGKWILDNKTYPLYQDGECPYMYGDFACGLYGREDKKFQQWRWQPHGCDVPRFDAKEILERLRGKRIILVGDSVMRNQWISMLCMFQSVIPSMFRKVIKVPNISLLNFKATEYNVSIGFYWAPLLVESNGDHPLKHRILDRMVRLDSIENHAKYWVDADVLIFNSYLWWKLPTMKILNGSFEDPIQHYKIVDKRSAYRMGLEAWSNWIHKNINHTRTQIYYMSMTATHFSGREWGIKHKGNCVGETEPITKEGFWESSSDLRMLRILENTLNQLKAKGGNVQMMNISQLTQYRKDAHPGINRLFYSSLKKKKLSHPKSYADCSHWCLPGAPDVWNELLLAHILRGHI